MNRFFSLILALAVLSPSRTFTQNSGETYRMFRNRDGKEIEAKIISVTSDWRSMKIVRRDGREFTIAPIQLSLDDQIYVRNWIEGKNDFPVTEEPSTAPPVPIKEPIRVTSWQETFQQRHTVTPQLIEDPGGKPLVLRGRVDVNEANPAGTIVAYGGRSLGIAVYVHEDRICVGARNGKRIKGFRDAELLSASAPLSALPKGEFSFEAFWTEDYLILEIDGNEVTRTESDGFLSRKPVDGFCVGFDSGISTVSPRKTPDWFPGTVRDVVFEINPETRN